LNQPWRILECVCSDATAKQRIEQQAISGEHSAGNRDFALYLEVKARFEEIVLPKAVINTEERLDACVELGMRALL
jgi:hypothetical protein